MSDDIDKELLLQFFEKSTTITTREVPQYNEKSIDRFRYLKTQYLQLMHL